MRAAKASQIRVRIVAASMVLWAALISGCATLTESDCRGAQWTDIGFRDARHARPEDRFAEHAKACSKYGVAPDHGAYFEGRKAGLQQYCTRRSGLQVGQAGESYENVCSAPNEQEFLVGFNVGHELYEARKRLEEVKVGIRRIEEGLRAKELSDDERRALVQRRIELEGERGAMQEALRRLESEVRQM